MTFFNKIAKYFIVSKTYLLNRKDEQMNRSSITRFEVEIKVHGSRKISVKRLQLSLRFIRWRMQNVPQASRTTDGVLWLWPGIRVSHWQKQPLGWTVPADSMGWGRNIPMPKSLLLKEALKQEMLPFYSGSPWDPWLSKMYCASLTAWL